MQKYGSIINDPDFFRLPKTIALVGMMGVGKTSIGRILAKRLDVPFKDSDHEVEAAAKCSVADIYAWYGEKAFRDTERLVIKRLSADAPHILSTGVEVFTHDDCRELLLENTVTVWLKASIDTIYPRVARRSHRPQLEQGNKKEILEKLIESYYPLYASAHIHVSCDSQTAQHSAESIFLKVQSYLRNK